MPGTAQRAHRADQAPSSISESRGSISAATRSQGRGGREVGQGQAVNHRRNSLNTEPAAASLSLLRQESVLLRPLTQVTALHTLLRELHLSSQIEQRSGGLPEHILQQERAQQKERGGLLQTVAGAWVPTCRWGSCRGRPPGTHQGLQRHGLVSINNTSPSHPGEQCLAALSLPSPRVPAGVCFSLCNCLLPV